MRIETTITVPASLAEVWEVLADYDQDHRWRADVVEMTATPSGRSRPGTATHEVVRFLGSTYVTDATVTHVSETPDQGRLRFEGEGDGTIVVGERAATVQPDGNVRVDTVLDIRLRGAMRLVEPLLGRVYARHVRRDLRRLRVLCTAPAPAART